jgi:RNA-directed DNA polymerase
VKDQTNESKPTVVAATPTQAGEATSPREAWGWVERCVWTERMLTRLTSGESANRVWFSLMDKTYAPANLRRALEKVWRNGGSAGADGQTVAHFARHAEAELQRLHEQLRDGSYRPQPVRRAWIAKLGSKEKRPLGIPAVRDRLVQGALRHVLEPIFETDFAEQSYGFRPGRGAKDALRRVDTLLQAGHHWVVDADLKSYLDRSSYYPSIHGVVGKSCGCWSNARIRRPFCRPRDTWTTESSPRFTRCMIVCRDTPRMRIASGMAT